MSAQKDPGAQVFLCPLCGPCLALVYEEADGTVAQVALHRDGVDHPDWFTYGDEGLPQ